MRIRIVRKPTTPSIDGIRLDIFEPGGEFEVGPTLAALLLVEGFAEPVVDGARQAADLPLAPARRAAALSNLYREVGTPCLDPPIPAETIRPQHSGRRPRKGRA